MSYKSVYTRAWMRVWALEKVDDMKGDMAYNHLYNHD